MPALTVTLDAPDEDLTDLPAAVEVACFRIVTEALTNVVRHAHATRCSVRIQLDHGLAVDVSDDGVGFCLLGIVLHPECTDAFGIAKGKIIDGANRESSGDGCGLNDE